MQSEERSTHKKQRNNIGAIQNRRNNTEPMQQQLKKVQGEGGEVYMDTDEYLGMELKSVRQVQSDCMNGIGEDMCCWVGARARIEVCGNTLKESNFLVVVNAIDEATYSTCATVRHDAVVAAAVPAVGCCVLQRQLHRLAT